MRKSTYDAVGQVLFAVLPGYLLQGLLLGDVDVDRYVAGFTALVGAGATPNGSRG